MVKINLLKKSGLVEEELPQVEETVVETPEPDKTEKSKKAKKSGGGLKVILFVLIIGAIGGSGYLAYSEGWFSPDIDSSPVETMVVADETPMDSPKETEVVEKAITKPPPKKLSKIDTKPKPVQSKPKTKSSPKQSPGKAVQRRGSELAQVIEGRILLEVFRSILSSVDDGMGNMKLTVSNSGVTLALGMNSREEAALLLRSIREGWPMSNLRAVRFERPNSPSEYSYATQFSGSVQFKGYVQSSGERKRSMLNTAAFKKKLTTLITANGLKLVRFKASSKVQMRGNSSIPITVTANGSQDSISKFIESLSKLDAAFGLARASILSKDSASSTVSLYLNLIVPNSKALS